jgi:hypothetical protein
MDLSTLLGQSPAGLLTPSVGDFSAAERSRLSRPAPCYRYPCKVISRTR